MNIWTLTWYAGYTGQLTAEHIAAHLPTNLKWAVAGRSQSKLQGVIDGCKKVNPDRKDPGELPTQIEC